MKKLSRYLPAICLIVVFVFAAAAKKLSKSDGYFELKVYHYSNGQQENIVDNFLQKDLLPYLHNSGIKNIGVFKAIANDTATDKKIYVLIPFTSLKQWEKYLALKANDPAITGNNEYTNSITDKPAYGRVETIFLKGFKFMPHVSVPQLTAAKSERVYELRSYESAGEKLHANKEHMFNEGGEIDLFARLGFNAVFYASVIHGAKMPNLMYMTSFENMKAREEHWASFRTDTVWKTLSARPEYQKNVSKSEIIFLRPTNYSDL